MPLLSLTLRNFRSYANCKLEALHRGLNIIVGPNGFGKSNFLRSLLFIFSDSVELNTNEYNAYVHKGVADASNQDVEVEAIIDNSDGRIPTSGRTIKLTRRWTPEGKDQLLINDRSTTRQQFSAMIDCLGLVYSNPYNIVPQGKISQITSMNDHQLYKMLQQSTGIRHYQLKIRQSQANLQKAKKERTEAEIIATEMDQKLKSLIQRKTQFQAYQKDTTHRQQRMAKDAWLQLNALNGILNKTRQQQSDKQKQVIEIRSRKTKAMQMLSDLQQECGILRQKLAYYCSEQIPVSLVVTQQQDYSHETRNHIQTIQDKQKQIRTLFKTATTRYQKAKEILAASKKAYEDRKIAQIGNTQVIEESLEAYTREIKQKQQEIEEMKKILSRPSQRITDRLPDTQLQASKSRLTSLEQSNKKNKMSMRQLKVRQVQCSRRVNQLQIEIKNKEAAFEAQFGRFSNRIGHLVNFQLIKKINQNNIKGVYGYLIDFLNIEPDVAFAYEIASKNKFFALIVEDQQTIKEVLKVAQSMKVRQLNMYSLDNLRMEVQQNRKIPQTQEVYPLINETWLGVQVPNDAPRDLQQNIRKLAYNIVGRHLLVRDYQTALKVAKQYHMNCITAQQEIVYADAFTCRVGADQKAAQCKLTLYKKILTRKSELAHLKEALHRQSKQSDELNNNQMELARMDKNISEQMKRTQLQITMLQQTQDQIQQNQENQRKKQEQLSVAQTQLQRLLSNRSQLAQAKNKRPASASQIEQLARQYQTKLHEANEAMDEYFALQGQLTQLQQTKKRMNIRFDELQQIEQNSKTVASLNPEMAVNKLKRDLQKCSQNIESMYKQTKMLQQQEDKMTQIVTQIVQKLSMHNIEKDALQKRAKNYNDEMIDEEVSVNSMVNRLYTAGDKVFFSRLTKIHTDFEELKKRIRQHQQVQGQLRRQLERCQQETQEVRNKIISVFSRHFDRVIARIMPNFKPDVRLTTTSNKIGLEILLNSDGFNRKWREYSGGQKTAISICLMTAIQQCNPALFYVFDEVDAPLDSTYRQRLSQLFLDKSTQSQYFITTFKKDMLSYDETECQYYEVVSQNRKSSINNVSKERAIRVLDQVQQQ